MELTKVSDGSIRLTGPQKAAILLCEIGSSPEGHGVARSLYKRLKLKPEQVKRLTEEIRALGYYDPFDEKMVRRENSVLEFFRSWGKNKGFAVKELTDFEAAAKAKVDPDYLKKLRENPDVVTNVLKNWLKD
ncbi:hypothetical protein [Treponema sp.]|uniref:hypothetical protein n=1 Tax=Treponema sp. TaxID=166 RepID=UPI0025CECC0F|nr:hypothetical protein [Treponema sp.]MCR5218494.1 hypothetical protein [Treponema sp.]